MAANLVVFKILFLVLIAHRRGSSGLSHERLVQIGANQDDNWNLSTPAEVEYAQPALESASVSESATSGGEQQVVATSEGVSPVPRDDPQTTAATATGESGDGEDSSEQSVVSNSPSASSPLPPPPTPLTQSKPQVNYAELCYLSNGGSSLTLTVNEATQMGAIIGTIDVNGDPTFEGGNVELMDYLPIQEQSFAASAATQQQSIANSNSNNMDSKQRRLQPRIAASTPPQTSDFYSILSAANGVNGQPQTNQLQSQHGSQPTATTQANQIQAVRLEPGTKNLVLVRRLDKESVEGEQGLLMNVRCRPTNRDHHQEASSTIPVRILITDANDHAPEFVGAQVPYVVNISETLPVGSIASRDVLALDKDSAGPYSTLHYQVLDDGSPHWHLLQFTNPLDPTLFVAAPLDYESVQSFTITIVASDQGEPEPQSATTQVQVNIIDFDDQNPRFLDEKYTLIMDETQQSLVGQNLQVLPRNLHAQDGDRGIDAQIIYSFDTKLGQLPAATPTQHNHLVGAAAAAEGDGGEEESIDSESSNIERYLHLNQASGEIRLLRQWPAKKWTTMTLVVRATQTDNKDRYTLTTLTITSRPTTTTNVLKPQPQSEDNKQSNKMVTNLAAGIEFVADKLTVNVLENVTLNEKIAKVRAKLLGKMGREVDVSTSTISPDSVDLITRPPEVAAKLVRPINYQILDDQMDQFGINPMGEIYVKKLLDYELRQEYKFRVLATYSKYSDICQVQVNVLNVNDNKPKAHDADLNDTISYSLTGECAHLFELSSPGGQLSLRAGNKQQLNVSQCQLIAQATDSLGPQTHTQQARINVQIAPQLIGRSLNLEPHPLASLDPASGGGAAAAAADGKLFNARSLVSGAGSQHNRDWLSSARFKGKDLQLQVQQQPQPPAPSNQRSSVATIVSSLQHMARSVNLLEMPMTSALLLSALLAFLVCLLFIVIISMSVHFYRRHAKQRRRRQLAAAAHLRHTQLTARLNVSAPSSGGSVGLLSPKPKHQQQRNPNNHRQAGSSSSSGSHSSQKSSPTNSTGASGSSPVDEDQLTPPAVNSALVMAARRPNLPTAKLTAKISPAMQQVDRAGSRQSTASGSHRSMRSPERARNPSSPLLLQRVSANPQATPMLSSAGGGASSLLSSMSSQSKRSYGSSNSTDDSSVMHCGHYSVQGASACKSPLDCELNDEQPEARSSRVRREEQNDNCSPVEAAIRSLVRGSSACNINQEMGKSFHNQRPSTTGELASRFSGSGNQQPSKSQQLINRELATLTNSKPGIKSYRKLPFAMGSLVRPLNRVGAIDDNDYEVDCKAIVNNNGYSSSSNANTVHDSAIASDASSPGSQISRMQQKQGLMAMIREPSMEQKRSLINSVTGNIRWPQEVIPQRVKKLTWDDELSCSGQEQQLPGRANDSALSPTSQHSDNYLYNGPSLQGTKSPMSPLSSHLYSATNRNTHNYTGDEQQQQQSAVEQHFLFSSSPCSPALLSASDLNNRHEQTMSPMMMGQNNCLDYTIVQSSQFHADSIAFEGCQHNSNGNSSKNPRPLPPLSSSAQQQRQQQQHFATGNRQLNNNNQPIYEPYASGLQRDSTLRHQDLDSLMMTTAVL